jgi:hypothetical protein
MHERKSLSAWRLQFVAFRDIAFEATEMIDSVASGQAEVVATTRVGDLPKRQNWLLFDPF